MKFSDETVEKVGEVDTTALVKKLENLEATDNDIRVRLLGFSHAFSPAKADRIYSDVSRQGYEQPSVVNNAQRLIGEGLLKFSGELLIPNANNPESLSLCVQAMTVVMDEILATAIPQMAALIAQLWDERAELKTEAHKYAKLAGEHRTQFEQQRAVME